MILLSISKQVMTTRLSLSFLRRYWTKEIKSLRKGNISFNEKRNIYRLLGPPLLLHVRLGAGEGAVGHQVADAPAPANLHIRLATIRGVLAAVLPIWIFQIRPSEF